LECKGKKAACFFFAFFFVFFFFASLTTWVAVESGPRSESMRGFFNIYKKRKKKYWRPWSESSDYGSNNKQTKKKNL
jgi:hypothetical protein